MIAISKQSLQLNPPRVDEICPWQMKSLRDEVRAVRGWEGRQMKFAIRRGGHAE